MLQWCALSPNALIAGGSSHSCLRGVINSIQVSSHTLTHMTTLPVKAWLEPICIWRVGSLNSPCPNRFFLQGTKNKEQTNK
eukprot:666625-Amphidinium_carterae.1